MLAGLGVELISTGGTSKALRDAGLDVRDVSDVTGFPEMLSGRVKTLHPKVHGGILGVRGDVDHEAAMREHAIEPIDLVCINLYPFEATVAKDGVTEPEAVEQIDIGGPAMVRSAAKNHDGVLVVTEPAQYGQIAKELGEHSGSTTRALRRAFAVAAFARTAAYDAAIAGWLDRDDPTPHRLTIAGVRGGGLRYGENPHQPGAVYIDTSWRGPSVIAGEQLAGKQLSYNNLADAAAALELAQQLGELGAGGSASVGACVVKHTNPCGAATAHTAGDAVRLAMAGDPIATYGGILALSGLVDADTAAHVAGEGSFFEVVIAPAFDAGAVGTLTERWKNCRLLAVGSAPRAVGARTFKSIPGGMLAQRADDAVPDAASWTHAAGPAPSAETIEAARALVCVVRALSSNAVCLGGRDGSGVRLFGAGAGQMDRVASCRLAVEKAGEHARASIAASDAFFPFDDGPRALIEAGATTIVHPGGSKRDGDTFALCDAHGVTCLTTGIRHFRH
ncbi:MAG: bifunctional purine biosynthesis protein PurH [Phycisphaeraceae bacterium]|nr:MAG: bifunctional purine biosynthesis protein PurH [Phycisphaeraceae bacterium]